MNQRPSDPHSASTVITAIGLLSIGVLAGCGGQEPTSNTYTAVNRDAFLAACTSSVEDDLLIRDVCECTYLGLTETIDIAEMARIEDDLRLDALTPLPDVVAEQMAECLISEAGL